MLDIVFGGRTTRRNAFSLSILGHRGAVRMEIAPHRIAPRRKKQQRREHARTFCFIFWLVTGSQRETQELALISLTT